MNDLFKGVAIGIPLCGRPVPADWAFAYKAMDTPINYNAVNICTQGMKVDEAREWLAKQAISQKCRYLFMLGDDTVPPPHVLRRFIFLMENNPEMKVLGGIYCTKNEPSFPLVFRGNSCGSYWNWKVGELFWVTGIGMDCTLIRTSVFQEIAEPWFLTIKADGHADDVAKVEAWTEDLYFCKQVTDKYGDRSIWADGSILCDHWDVKTMRKWSLPWNCKPAIRGFVTGKKKILDLGAGTMKRLFPDGVPTRVDLREESEPDYRCDIRALPFESESWDVVHASHTLEHFSQKEVGSVLDEWLRVLKVGGELRLSVPDLTVAAKQILDGGLNGIGMNVLYGQQSYALDFHKCGFTPLLLKDFLERKGLRIKTLRQEAPYHIICEATKVKARGMTGDGEGRPLFADEVGVSQVKAIPQLAAPKAAKRKR